MSRDARSVLRSQLLSARSAAVVTLPRGRGRGLASCVDELADFIRDDLKGALGAEAIVAKRRGLEEQTQRQVQAIVEPFEKLLEDAGLAW